MLRQIFEKKSSSCSSVFLFFLNVGAKPDSPCYMRRQCNLNFKRAEERRPAGKGGRIDDPGTMYERDYGKLSKWTLFLMKKPSMLCERVAGNDWDQESSQHSLESG